MALVQESEQVLKTQVNELNKQLEFQFQALSVAMAAKEQLQKEIEDEKESNQVLNDRITELTQQMEERESEVRPIPRDFSFASSEFQVSLICPPFYSSFPHRRL